MKAVILAGGIGSRLWPLSRELYPKQLIPILGDLTLLQATIQRAVSLGMVDIYVLSMHHFRFYVQEQIDELGLDDAISVTIVLEPSGKNTAGALALTSLLCQPKDQLFVMPSDHVLDHELLLASMDTISQLVDDDKLLTFGITPTVPHTGYGYIKKGDLVPGYDDVFRVASFVEKPDRQLAESYLKSNNYVWNSGLFCFKAECYLAELQRYCPEIYKACCATVATQYDDLGFIKFSESCYDLCPNQSIDYAVMEHTQHAVTLPLASLWSDLGTWSSLYEYSEKDDSDNVVVGDVITHDVRGCLIRSPKRLVAAAGVEDLVVVDSADALLIASKDNDVAFKYLLDQLKLEQRDERVVPKKVLRPWGRYEILYSVKYCEVRLVVVLPGKEIKLHDVDGISKHWNVIDGEVEVFSADTFQVLSSGDGIVLQGQHGLVSKSDKETTIIETKVYGVG